VQLKRKKRTKTILRKAERVALRNNTNEKCIKGREIKMKKTVSLFLAVMLLVSILPTTPAQAKTTAPTITKVTEAIYNEVGIYSDGLVLVKEGNTYKYLNEKGKVVIDLSDAKYKSKNEKISEAGYFYDGLALITLKSNENAYLGGFYIDKKGKIALTTAQVNKQMTGKNRKISGLHSVFSEGVTISDGRPEDMHLCVINKDGSGKWYPGSYSDYYWYTEGLLCTGNYKNGNFYWHYVDKNFKNVISANYDDARPFNQDLAPVKINDKWGFINKSGKIVIRAQFENFAALDSYYSYKVFNDGLAAVQKGGKWGLIDKSGKTVIAYKYAEPLFFINGYTCVKGSNGKYTYIDKKGKTAFITNYDDANYFSKSGIAVVGNHGVYKLINKKGEQVSKKTWKFDRTGVSITTPDIINYKIGKKWGIAVVK
jgi:hypothetical protein